MNEWPSTNAKKVLKSLLRIGWSIKRQSGSHKTLYRLGWPDYIFAFHDNEEIGPKMLSRISKRTGLKPEDLQPILLTWSPLLSRCLSSTNNLPMQKLLMTGTCPASLVGYPRAGGAGARGTQGFGFIPIREAPPGTRWRVWRVASQNRHPAPD